MGASFTVTKELGKVAVRRPATSRDVLKVVSHLQARIESRTVSNT